MSIMMLAVCLRSRSTQAVLAGDWGATTTISRKFGSGWEVGGYITLTDVPFDTFGEGSFDKAIYVSAPIDWFISSPSRSSDDLHFALLHVTVELTYQAQESYTGILKAHKMLSSEENWGDCGDEMVWFKR